MLKIVARWSFSVYTRRKNALNKSVDVKAQYDGEKVRKTHLYLYRKPASSGFNQRTDLHYTPTNLTTKTSTSGATSGCWGAHLCRKLKLLNKVQVTLPVGPVGYTDSETIDKVQVTLPVEHANYVRSRLSQNLIRNLRNRQCEGGWSWLW